MRHPAARYSRPWLSLSVILLLTACGGGQDWAGRTETIDGVVHVYNPAVPLWGTGHRAMEEVEVLGADAASEEELLASPIALATGPDGTRYVLDQSDRRVVRYGPDGVFLGSFGRQGEGPGEFVNPSDLEILADGTLVVSDYGNGRVSLFDPDGTFRRSFRAGAHAGQIAVSGPGGLWVINQPRSMELSVSIGADTGEVPALVERYDLEGEVIGGAGTPVESEGMLMPFWKNKVYIASLPNGGMAVNWLLDDRLETYGPDGALQRVIHRPSAFQAREPTEDSEVTEEGGVRMRFEFDILSMGLAREPSGGRLAVSTALDPTDFRPQEEQDADPRPYRWAIDLFDDQGRWLARHEVGEEMPGAMLEWERDGLWVINHQGDATVRRFRVVPPGD